MTKLLTQPLLISIVLLLAGIIVSASRARRSRQRVALVLISVGTSALLVFSIPFVGSLLDRSLAIEPSAGPMRPEYVVVLSGGYQTGARPELDVLTPDTIQRVIMGVLVWRDAPLARMVMTGAVPKRGRDLGRITELMAMAAISRGVPPSAIIRETMARNTREHPGRVLALPGVGSRTRIALVTSSVHERRALIEFRRYFAQVEARPVPDARVRSVETWTDLLPQNDGLFESTAAIQEWIGILWYRVLALRDGSPSPRFSRKATR